MERISWTQEEDEALRFLKEVEGIDKWAVIAEKLAQNYGIVGRSGKQCRERFNNHLDSNIAHTHWSEAEEEVLFKLHNEYGNKWSKISQSLPGRTDNHIKNHFYSKLRKAIRKLNRNIEEHFKKSYKEIKMTVLSKIIEGADEKFKSEPFVREEVSEECHNLKNRLLEYSEDSEPSGGEDLRKVRAIVQWISDFDNRYRKKPKTKVGKGSLNLPKSSQKSKKRRNPKGRAHSQHTESEEEYVPNVSEEEGSHRTLQRDKDQLAEMDQTHHSHPATAPAAQKQSADLQPLGECPRRKELPIKMIEDKLMEYGIMESMEEDFLFSTDYAFKVNEEPKKLDMFGELPNLALGISFNDYDFLENANTIFHEL